MEPMNQVVQIIVPWFHPNATAIIIAAQHLHFQIRPQFGDDVPLSKKDYFTHTPLSQDLSSSLNTSLITFNSKIMASLTYL